jgi:hypothetical protein
VEPALQLSHVRFAGLPDEIKNVAQAHTKTLTNQDVIGQAGMINFVQGLSGLAYFLIPFGIHNSVQSVKGEA